jgi:DNA-binding MarR family transcriptional regulator
MTTQASGTKARYVSKAFMNLRAKMGVKFEIGQLLILTKIYEKGERGTPMVELGRQLDSSAAFVGRNVMLFSRKDEKKGSSRNLIEIFYDPAHPRSKSVRMTEEGRELLSSLLSDLRPYFNDNAPQ